MEKNEQLSARQVADTIVCRDCKFKKGGGLGGPQYTKGVCEKFPYPESKPSEVLFEGADCEEYEHE